MSPLRRKKQSGQIIFEYVLGLVVGVTIATFLTSTLVSRNPENPGLVVAKWENMLRRIGADLADSTATP